jgi:hypothetical protein
MKPRLLMRTLCLGAALFIPVGGLTVLGVGTAGATTAQISGQIKLGTGLIFGKIIVATLLCTLPTSGGKQCPLTAPKKTGQFKVTKTGAGTNIKALVSGALLATISTGKISGMAVKKGWRATIKASGGLPGNGCVIGTGPKIVFTISSTGLRGTIATKSLASVTVGGSTCTAATRTIITNDLTGTKLSGTITFSAA